MTKSLLNATLDAHYALGLPLRMRYGDLLDAHDHHICQLGPNAAPAVLLLVDLANAAFDALSIDTLPRAPSNGRPAPPAPAP